MTRYVMTAVDVDGEQLGERFAAAPPGLGEVAALGDGCRTNYVSVADDQDLVTLYGRDAGGSWSVLAAGVGEGIAAEVRLWFDLTQHYQGPPAPGDDHAGPAGGHPLDAPPPAPPGGPLTAERAVSLVVERIGARGLDYPTTGLSADRFAAGWSVYAPVEVDESDPMAFLDMPVGRSVFLVSDLGRVKETSSSIPPPLAEAMFTAEEAYVRGDLAGEDFMDGLRAEALWREAVGEEPAGIASFTVETPPEAIAAVAEALLDPIAQQVALLGPRGWDRLAAVFSLTVSGEVAQLRFFSGDESVEVRVPEQLALLVRRQRHLAARLPAGPWWRLLLDVTHTGGLGARISTEYDYGDRPFPDDQTLAPEQYRDDLAAYPRAHAPAWLTAYIAGATGPARDRTPAPLSARTPAPEAARTPVPEPEPDRTPAPGSATRDGAAPVLDTKVGWSALHADPRTIHYGKKSIALDEAEWVTYTATRTAEKRFLYPTTYFNTWDFRVGRYPYSNKDAVSLAFSKGGRRAEQPEVWTFLVDLVKRYLEPRLLEELLGRVRRGETVMVGGSLRVDRDGIACLKPRLSLPWAEVSPARPHNGAIWIYRKGAEKPELNVPLSNPNAALIPDLFAALGA